MGWATARKLTDGPPFFFGIEDRFETEATTEQALRKDYVRELSEVRMVRRAPLRPFALTGEDARYIEATLRDVEAAFGLEAFPGVGFATIPGRVLIETLIDWWRALEPSDEAQREAHARLPGAIRLLDTFSAFMEERMQREKDGPPAD